jgi:protein TonB
VKAPRLLFRVEPAYPVLARQAKLEGNVVIDAVIDEHGNVVSMRVLSGSPLLIQAAMDALRQWKYEPTAVNGQPVPVQLTVTISFRLT